MAVISMKQLLEAGVHFGHQTRRWNPKMKKYIYAARNDIHIIDLQLTVGLIEEAYSFIVDTVRSGKSILFVGTKKQAQEAIAQEAERCGQFYINSRWLGGTLTNFKTIRSRVDRLNRLANMEKLGEFDLLPKKEVLKLRAEMQKLQTNLGGIRDMHSLPGAMFIIDPDFEEISVSEARKLNIPIVAITDTNCDPDLIDYVIPGNDDAIRAIKLISSVVADAVIEANQGETPTVSLDGDSIEAHDDLSAETDTAEQEHFEVKAEKKVKKPVKEELAAEIKKEEKTSKQADEVKAEEKEEIQEAAVTEVEKAEEAVKADEQAEEAANANEQA